MSLKPQWQNCAQMLGYLICQAWMIGADCIFTRVAWSFYCDIKLVILSTLHPVFCSSSHCFIALTPWFVPLLSLMLVKQAVVKQFRCLWSLFTWILIITLIFFSLACFRTDAEQVKSLPPLLLECSVFRRQTCWLFLC